MNRFESGYDDLFDAAEGGRTESERPGGSLPPELSTFLNGLSGGSGDRTPGDSAEGAPGRPASRSGGRIGGQAPSKAAGGPSMRVPVDMLEVPDGLLFQFDLPGVRDEDVELAAAPRAIRLRATRRLPAPQGGRVRRRERGTGAVERIVPVPEGYDSAELEARLEAGVLTVLVPRRAAADPGEGEAPGGGDLWNLG